MRVVKKYITMEAEFENECNESSLKYTSLTTRRIFILTIRGLCFVFILDVQEFEWICPLLHHHFFKTIIRAWVLIYQCFYYKTHKKPCVRFNLLGHLCHSPELLKMVLVRRCVSCVKNWDTLATFFFRKLHYHDHLFFSNLVCKVEFHHSFLFGDGPKWSKGLCAVIFIFRSQN